VKRLPAALNILVICYGCLHQLWTSNSMHQSPSWEANSQHIPCLWWNPTVHYRVHKSPPPASIHISHRSNLIPFSHLCLRFPRGLFLSDFPTKIPCMHFTYLPCVPHAPPSHPWHDNPSNIWWSEQVTALLIMQSSPASRRFLIGSNQLPSDYELGFTQ
jgi:hypothetical protein